MLAECYGVTLMIAAVVIFKSLRSKKQANYIRGFALSIDMGIAFYVTTHHMLLTCHQRVLNSYHSKNSVIHLVTTKYQKFVPAYPTETPNQPINNKRSILLTPLP
jgi:hypothetical protein